MTNNMMNMKLEVPNFKRCLFCVPLRYGILIFGYLNLMFILLITSLKAYLDYSHPAKSLTITLYRGVGMFTEMWLPYVLYAFEIIFNIVLLVGAHTKQTRLIRVYYYYGILTTVAACLMFVVVSINNQNRNFFFNMVDICTAFSGLVLQVYLLLLIRTELQKLKQQQQQQGQFCYVNHMSEVLLEPPVIGNGRNPL